MTAWPWNGGFTPDKRHEANATAGISRSATKFAHSCAADSPDGQIAHGRYAQIARRANLSQPVGVAVTPKSAADFAPSRPQ
jgi:hypothetical protein